MNVLRMMAAGLVICLLVTACKNNNPAQPNNPTPTPTATITVTFTPTQTVTATGTLQPAGIWAEQIVAFNYENAGLTDSAILNITVNGYAVTNASVTLMTQAGNVSIPFGNLVNRTGKEVAQYARYSGITMVSGQWVTVSISSLGQSASMIGQVPGQITHTVSGDQSSWNLPGDDTQYAFSRTSGGTFIWGITVPTATQVAAIPVATAYPGSGSYSLNTQITAKATPVNLAVPSSCLVTSIYTSSVTVP